MKTARELSGLLGETIEDHPYDRGYWSRYAKLPRPARGPGRRGWNDCDEDLRNEAKEKA